VSRDRDAWIQTANAHMEQAKTLGQQLADIHASPGWRLIKKYRDWLNSNLKSRPWLMKLIEPVARWFLQTAARRTPASPTPTDIIPAVSAVAPAVEPETPNTFSYEDWIAEQEPDDRELAVQRERVKSFSYQPKVSIIVPVYKVPFTIVEQMIASVVAQTYTNWELCLAHGDPEDAKTRSYLASLADRDKRFKVTLLDENRGISGNSNQALTLVTGDFIAMLDHDDMLAPFALFEVVQALNEQPSIDFLYSDRDKIKETGNPIQRLKPLFKPQWSPEILLCANYLCHFNVIAAEHIRAIGGWREETDGAQDWDLFLRVSTRAKNIRHLPRVLYHWREIATSVSGAGLAAKPYAEEAQLRTVRDHCRRQGWNAEVALDPHRRIRVLWKPQPAQKTSVILVSTAPDAAILSHAQRLLASTADPPTELVLSLASDSLPQDPPLDPRIRAVRVHPGASVAEKIGRAVEHSIGEILVFVDQGVTPSDADWLNELVGPLENREIGIVGARILNPATSNIYHAGIVFSENRPEYIYTDEPVHFDGDFGTPLWYRNYTAVSGACFSVRRKDWDAVGALSGPYRYPRLDLDLCLKVRCQAGLRVLYNPFARFFQSRPAVMETVLPNVSREAANSYLQECLPGGDPYFHTKLICRDGKVRLRRRADSRGA